MLSKPEACRGCPLWQDGRGGFVPDIDREGSIVKVYGQNPGAQEEQEGVPFVGQTGQEMDRSFLPQAGLTRESISIGNALRCRWQNSNKLPDIQSKLAREAVEFCTRAHFKVSSGTSLLVAQGGYALLALTGHGWLAHDKVTNWRGWMLPRKGDDGQIPVLDDVYTPRVGGVRRDGRLPVLCTVHLAAVGYDPSLRLPAKVDWQKVGKFLKGTWPETPPPMRTDPDHAMWVSGSAFDTEWNPETGQVLRFSLATPERRVYVIEWATENLRKVRESLESRRVPLRLVLQNAVADLPQLAKVLPSGAETGRTSVDVEDTMLCHSVLHGGFPHDLDYLSSLYGRYNRSKHLVQLNPIVYSGMDAALTLDVWRALERELKADPQSERIYREHVLPLIPVIMEAEAAGVLIDQAEVAKGIGYLQHEIDDAVRTAQAAAGYKLNLGSSPQVGRQLYDVEKHHAPRGRPKGR